METHTSLSSDVSVRDRWLITALLGLGLITFAIDASNTRLVLPQMMTSLRVESCTTRRAGGLMKAPRGGHNGMKGPEGPHKELVASFAK